MTGCTVSFSRAAKKSQIRVSGVKPKHRFSVSVPNLSTVLSGDRSCQRVDDVNSVGMILSVSAPVAVYCASDDWQPQLQPSSREDVR